MTARIPLAIPHLAGNEAEYVGECLRTGMVSSVGSFVSRFEEEFASFVGARHAVACSSGTAALHVALRLVGVAPGADVLVSDLTFVASVNAVAYLHARPVLVDAEDRTWNMDPALVRRELERRREAAEPMPAAIEVVHVLGQPADLVPLLEIADEYGVPLVEDAAEALGASYVGGPLDGRQVGTIGRVGAFSFNGNKIITTGGGGMIVTDDPDLAARAKHLTTQAKLPDVGYLHDEVGYNYRLTNVAAALGVAQLEQLPGFLGRKRAIADRYDAAFEGLPGVSRPPRAPWFESSSWLYSILCGPRGGGSGARDEMLRVLAEHGIDSRPLWRPIHAQPAYAGVKVLGGTIGCDVFERGLSLPCSVQMTEAQQAQVIDVVRATAARW